MEALDQHRRCQHHHQHHQFNKSKKRKKSSGASRIFIQEARSILENEAHKYYKKQSSVAVGADTDADVGKGANSNQSLEIHSTSTGGTMGGEFEKETVPTTATEISSVIVKSQCSFRIMGRVVQILPLPPPSQLSPPPSSSLRLSSYDGEKGCVFIVDDGTACIEVILLFSQNLLLLGGLNNHGEILVGDCIDCVGKLLCQRSTTATAPSCASITGLANDDNSRGDALLSLREQKKEQKTDDICDGHELQMVVESYSKVTDPNLETLRMIELSSSARTAREYPFDHYQSSNSAGMYSHKYQAKSKLIATTIDTESNQDENQSSTSISCTIGGKDSGIYMYGDPMSKLAPFRREKNILPTSSCSASKDVSKSLYLQRIERFHRLHQQKLIVNRDHILNLIKHSKPDGLFESDLVLLLDCDTSEEIEALKKGLEEMRSNYDIYISKTGSYLPL